MTSHVENRGCIKALREFDDGFFDLAIVDPPYGSGGSRDAYKAQKPVDRTGVGTSALHKDKVLTWDVRPPRSYWEELFRVSKNQIVWGGNYFGDVLPTSRCWIAWVKPNISDKFSMANVELAWTSFCANSKHIDIASNVDPKNRIHPTQKPRALYEELLRRFAKPGDKILDTHLGSGTSREAAYLAGLDFWGYEVDPVMYKKHEERFDRFLRTDEFAKKGLNLVVRTSFAK